MGFYRQAWHDHTDILHTHLQTTRMSRGYVSAHPAMCASQTLYVQAYPSHAHLGTELLDDSVLEDCRCKQQRNVTLLASRLSAEIKQVLVKPMGLSWSLKQQHGLISVVNAQVSALLSLQSSIWSCFGAFETLKSLLQKSKRNGHDP